MFFTPQGFKLCRELASVIALDMCAWVCVIGVVEISPRDSHGRWASTMVKELLPQSLPAINGWLTRWLDPYLSSLWKMFEKNDGWLVDGGYFMGDHDWNA